MREHHIITASQQDEHPSVIDFGTAARLHHSPHGQQNILEVPKAVKAHEFANAGSPGHNYGNLETKQPKHFLFAISELAAALLSADSAIRTAAGPNSDTRRI